MKNQFILLSIISLLLLLSFSPCKTRAQTKANYFRIAKIIVKADKLEAYTLALKEGMETAVRVEPGVLSLRALSDKTNPTRITVFEIYADVNAYNFHIQTQHFKKYKATVADMVESLELNDVAPIVFADKTK